MPRMLTKKLSVPAQSSCVRQQELIASLPPERLERIERRATALLRKVRAAEAEKRIKRKVAGEKRGVRRLQLDGDKQLEAPDQGIQVMLVQDVDPLSQAGMVVRAS